jgi:hypothetical protein
MIPNRIPKKSRVAAFLRVVKGFEVREHGGLGEKNGRILVQAHVPVERRRSTKVSKRRAERAARRAQR